MATEVQSNDRLLKGIIDSVNSSLQKSVTEAMQQSSTMKDVTGTVAKTLEKHFEIQGTEVKFAVENNKLMEKRLETLTDLVLTLVPPRTGDTSFPGAPTDPRERAQRAARLAEEVKNGNQVKAPHSGDHRVPQAFHI